MICYSVAIFSLLILLDGFGPLKAQPVRFEGQLSALAISKGKDDLLSRAGLRYLPKIYAAHRLSNNISIDADLSLNLLSTAAFPNGEDIETTSEAKFYRLWGRLSGDQYEMRIGLQKINFGSAVLLRPLMWFDRIDPRDPLQLTDGVYAALFRYYFLNNANLWIWGLPGDGTTKGRELIPSPNRSVEFGGRLQLPLFSGEFALTGHHRKLDVVRIQILPDEPYADRENRVGIDGKWDAGIGIWFETSVAHQPSAPGGFRYLRQTTIGADYTFGIGHGLGAIFEHFIATGSENLFGRGEGGSFSALMTSYPISLIDNVGAIFYRDWDNHAWFRTLTMQRTYDNWQFFLIGFWNPDDAGFNPVDTVENPFAGKGLQFTAVFNH